MSRPIAKHSDGSDCYTKGCSRGTHVSTTATVAGIPSSSEFTADLLQAQERQKTWKNLSKTLRNRYNQKEYPMAPDPQYDEFDALDFYQMVEEIQSVEDFHEATKRLLLSEQLQHDTNGFLGALAENEYCPKEVVFLAIKKGLSWDTVRSAIKNRNLTSKDLSNARKLLVNRKTLVTEWSAGDAHYGFSVIANHPSADAEVLHDLIVEGWQQADVDSYVIENPNTSASTLLYLSLNRPDRVRASLDSQWNLRDRDPEMFSDFLGHTSKGMSIMDASPEPIAKSEIEAHIESVRTKYGKIIPQDVLEQALTKLRRSLT